MEKKENIKFIFKKISNEDIPLLHKWFDEAHVREWWPTLGKNESIEQFLTRIRSKNTFAYLVILNDKPIGYIQYYFIDRIGEKSGSWLPELPESTVGTDQFIGDASYIGKGYETLFIKEFIKFLQKIEPHITTVIVDPDPSNVAAIKCYEKVGFKQIGIFNVTHGQHLLMKYDIKNESEMFN